MSRDIKDLLGAAIGAEPPLGIDRDAVFEAGRKRLRRRRLLQSGSVVAAVVVAVFGAATLTGLGSNSTPGPSMPPAASRTGAPETSRDGTTTNEQPPSAHVTTTTRPADLAGNLTAQLYTVLSTDYVSPQSGKPAFHEKDRSYLFNADIKRPTGDGSLQVTVEFDHPKGHASCADVPDQIEGCTTQEVHGVTVVYGDFRYENGARGVAAAAVLPGAVKASAIATNWPSWAQEKDKAPEGKPVFTKDELAELLVRAGFRAR